MRVTVLSLPDGSTGKLVAHPQDAGGERAREAAKIEVGAVHVLHRQAHRVTSSALHFGRFPAGSAGFALIPGQLVARDHVVTVQAETGTMWMVSTLSFLANSR